MDTQEGAYNKMEIVKPYFMNRSEWYYFDEKEFCYKLTEKAPFFARQSYERFYRLLDKKGVKK